MGGEYDEKFEQLTSVVEKVVGRVDELRLEEVRDLGTEVRELRTEVHSNTSRLGSLEGKVDLLAGQFKDVAGLVIRDHHPRIENLEKRANALEADAH